MDSGNRPVSEIMQTDLVTVSLHDRLDFADQVMRLGRIRHLPVLHQGHVVGIVSNRDILAASLPKCSSLDRSDGAPFYERSTWRKS